MVASQCTAYWQCNRLDVDWDKHERPWEVLVELARKGRRGTAVEERDLFSKAAPPSAVATLFGRLKRLLPADLREYIVPGNNPRSYHLTLDPSQITVIDQPA